MILAQEQMAFEAWRDSLETVPTIKALRTKAEDIRQSEFEKVGRLSSAWSLSRICCCFCSGPCRASYPTLLLRAAQLIPLYMLSPRLMSCRSRLAVQHL